MSARPELQTSSSFQLGWQELVGIVVTFIVSAFANASGIGGGAFFVPLFNVLIGFSLKASTALSQAVITSGVLASVGLNLFKPHPRDIHACIINFLLVLLFTPMLLLGVNTGVILNVMFPDWLITILLVLLIAYLTIKAYKKGIMLWRAESVRLREKSELSPLDGDEAAHQRTEVARHKREGTYQDPVVGSSEKGYVAIELQTAHNASRTMSRKGSRSLAEAGHQQPSEGRGSGPAGEPRRQQDSPTPSTTLVSLPLHCSPHSPAAQGDLEGPTVPGPEGVFLSIRTASQGGPPFVEEDREDVQVYSPIEGPSISTSHEGAHERAHESAPSSSHSQPQGGRDDGGGGDNSQVHVKLEGQPVGQQAVSPEHMERHPQTPGAHADHRFSSSSLLRDFPKSGIQYPKINILELLALWVAFLVLQVLKNVVSGECSTLYWVLLGLQVALMMGTTLGVTAQTVHKVARQRGSLLQDSTLADGRLQYRWRSLLWCQLLTLVAGVIGGLLGIGGGMIVGPLLLELGVAPQVSSATSSLMVLFSSSVAVVQFALIGRLNLIYAAVFGGVSLISSIIGVTGVGMLVRRSGRPSVIVFTLATVVAVGGLIMGVFGLKKAVYDFRDEKNIGFENYCSQ